MIIRNIVKEINNFEYNSNKHPFIELQTKKINEIANLKRLDLKTGWIIVEIIILYRYLVKVNYLRGKEKANFNTRRNRMMKREKMIDKLINEIEYIDAYKTTVKEYEELTDFVEWFDDAWQSLENDNEITNTDNTWRKEGYIISFIFREYGIDISAGLTDQELVNATTWTTYKWEDLTDDTLKALLELYGE